MTLDNTQRRPRPGFRARLSCGDVIWLRDHPMSDKARFGCNAGRNHGYNLWWELSWSVDDPERVSTNRLYAEMKAKEAENETA